MRLLQYTKCSVLCLVYSSLLHKLLRLANRLLFPAPSFGCSLFPAPSLGCRLFPAPSVGCRLFPAPSLGCRLFPILLKCAECTAFPSILRRSSSIVASLFVLITLIPSWLFSLLTSSCLLNLKEFVYYICHNDVAEFLYSFHAGLEMLQLFVRTLMAKNIL